MKKYIAIIKRIDLLQVLIEADNITDAKAMAVCDEYTIMESDPCDSYTKIKSIKLKKED